MTEPYYTDEAVTLYHGDNRELLAQLPPNSVEACVTDPPYELGFMGRKWDSNGIAYDKWLWAEVWRVLKPGGHLLAFGGTRTWHRLAVAIEDAGFEVRDSIAWMYGSGFPKSLDVSKAIDKAAGAEREVVGVAKGAASSRTASLGQFASEYQATTPATDAAREWQGWGTALKPAFEPVVVARKPLIGTVAANVQEYGTGALNIDACRIGTEGEVLSTPKSDPHKRGAGAGEYAISTRNTERMHAAQAASIERTNTLGRWPANVILDESQAAELDRQSGDRPTSKPGQVIRRREPGDYSSESIGAESRPAGSVMVAYGDTGGASRFFYTAKASSTERPREGDTAHPTVKPLDLMRYLVRLVTPPGGTVLEPFAGSGTTAEACIIEGFKCIAMELTPEYLPLIVQRITKPIEPVMF